VPPSYDDVLPGEERCFDITLTVPEGTPEGDVTFTVAAVDSASVAYGAQTVTIHVIVNQPPDCSGAYPSVAMLWPRTTSSWRSRSSESWIPMAIRS